MKHINLSVAIAAVLAAGAANALPIETTAAIDAAYVADLADNGVVNGTTNVVLVAGGASAARDAFRTILTRTTSPFCVAGSVSQFQASPTTNQDFRAYSCTLASAAPVPAALFGKNAIIYYRAEGGSAWGPVSLVADNMSAVAGFTLASLVEDTIKGLKVQGTSAGTAACVATATASVFNCPVTSYSLATDTATAGNVQELRTELAVADTEPVMFGSDASYPTSSKFDSFNAGKRTALGGLATNQGFIQIFGLLVSTTGPTAGISNITTAQATGILTQTIVDWGQVDGTLTVGNNPIVVCRREQGSGTQVTHAMRWLNEGCGATYGFPLDNDPVPGGPDTDAIVENGTSASLTTCVTGAGANGGVTSATMETLGFNPGNTPGSIGVSNPGVTGAPLGTKFLNIDGIAPSVLNAGTGAYKVTAELSLTKRPSLSTLNPFADSLAGAIITEVQKAAGVPDGLGNLAIPGLAGNTGNGGTTTDPVANQTRGGVSCRPDRT